jgi:hypothetical protein
VTKLRVQAILAIKKNNNYINGVFSSVPFSPSLFVKRLQTIAFKSINVLVDQSGSMSTGSNCSFLLLYKLVKSQFPDLSSKARSLKMLDLMKDKKVIKDIKASLPEIKKAIAEHRKQKEEAYVWQPKKSNVCCFSKQKNKISILKTKEKHFF